MHLRLESLFSLCGRGPLDNGNKLNKTIPLRDNDNFGR